MNKTVMVGGDHLVHLDQLRGDLAGAELRAVATPPAPPGYGAEALPASCLSAAERERLSTFPGEIGELDLATYFTLTAEDQALTEQRRRPANRLGFALQLCTLRHLGIVPR